MQAQISDAQTKMAALQGLSGSNTKRASRIPALPRTGLPRQETINGQAYTCAPFGTAPVKGEGWEITPNGTLSLDENAGFYGLGVDQFAVNPTTLQKIPAQRAGGKVLYKVRSDSDFI